VNVEVEMARKKKCPNCGSKRVKNEGRNGGAVPVETLGPARPRDPVLGRKRQDLVDDVSLRERTRFSQWI
jgi:hypothetical protein